MRTLIATFRAFGESLLFSLCKLNEIQFSAPWAPAKARCG